MSKNSVKKPKKIKIRLNVIYVINKHIIMMLNCKILSLCQRENVSLIGRIYQQINHILQKNNFKLLKQQLYGLATFQELFIVSCCHK